MTTRFRLNPAGVVAFSNSPAALAHVAKVAATIARDAASLAPVRTGALASSYASTPPEPSAPGATARAYSTDLAGSLAEFGSVNNPPYRALTRAAQRAGNLDLKGKGES